MNVDISTRDGVYEFTVGSFRLDVHPEENRIVVFEDHYTKVASVLSAVGGTVSQLHAYDWLHDFIESLAAELTDLNAEVIRVILAGLEFATLHGVTTALENLGRGVVASGDLTATSMTTGTATTKP